jgi:hypothetical protein
MRMLAEHIVYSGSEPRRSRILVVDWVAAEDTPTEDGSLLDLVCIDDLGNVYRIDCLEVGVLEVDWLGQWPPREGHIPMTTAEAIDKGFGG